MSVLPFFAKRLEDLTLADIQRLIGVGARESVRLDFKRGPTKKDDPSNVLNALTAFANTSGGRVLLGVESKKQDDDENQITGFAGIELNDRQQILDSMARRAASKIDPPLRYEQHPIEIEASNGTKKHLIVFEVEPSTDAPHQFEGRFPFRQGAVCEPMSTYQVGLMFRNAERLRGGNHPAPIPFPTNPLILQSESEHPPVGLRVRPLPQVQRVNPMDEADLKGFLSELAGTVNWGPLIARADQVEAGGTYLRWQCSYDLTFEFTIDSSHMRGFVSERSVMAAQTGKSCHTFLETQLAFSDWLGRVAGLYESRSVSDRVEVQWVFGRNRKNSVDRIPVYAQADVANRDESQGDPRWCEGIIETDAPVSQVFRMAELLDKDGRNRILAALERRHRLTFGISPR